MTSEYTSSEGRDYKIEIHDADLGMSQADTFTTTTGAVLKQHAETKTGRGYIHAMSCEFGLLIQDNTTETFAASVGEDELRWYVKVYEGSQLQFVGYLPAETITQYNEPQPTEITVEASNMIGTLSDLTDGINTTWTTFPIVLKTILSNTNIDDLYGASDRFLGISAIWYEDDMSGTGIDPMDEVFISHHSFYESEEHLSSEKDYFDLKEILLDLCEAFQARLYMDKGVFVFEQYDARAGSSTVDRYYYDKTGGALTSETISTDITVDQQDTSVMWRGQWDYLPPLGEFIMHYVLSNPEDPPLGYPQAENYLEGFDWSNSNDSAQTVGELDISATSGDVFLQWDVVLDLEHTSPTAKDPNPEWHDHKHLFEITVQVGSYYLEREWIGNGYQEAYEPKSDWEWKNSPATWDILLYHALEFFKMPDGNVRIQFKTPAVPESGDVTIRIRRIEIVNIAGATRPQGDYTLTWSMATGSLTAVVDDGGDEEKILEKTFTVTNEGGLKRERQKVHMGDGPNSTTFRRIRIGNSVSTSVPSDSWAVNSLAGGDKLLSLAAQSVMNFREKRRKILMSQVYYSSESANFFFGCRLNYDGDFYIPTNLEWNTNLDQTDGELIEIASEATEWTPTEGEVLLNDPLTSGDDDEDGLIGVPPDNDAESWLQTNDVVSGTVTELPINAANFPMMRKGDVIKIFDVATSKIHSATVAAPVQEGDTVIEIESKAFSPDVPPWSFILPSPGNHLRVDGYEFFDVSAGDLAVDGTEITVTNFTLLDPATVSEAEIRSRVNLYRTTFKQVYGKHFSIDAGSNKITGLRAFRGSDYFELIQK